MFNGLKCSENKHILSQVLTTGLFPRQLRWAVVWMADATGGRTNHMTRCWLATASSSWWWWAGRRWPSSVWAFSSVSSPLVPCAQLNRLTFHFSLRSVGPVIDLVAIRETIAREHFFPFACVCVHTCISSHWFSPFKRTHSFQNKEESPIDFLLISSTNTGPPRVICKLSHTCCVHAKVCSIVFSPIESLFGSSCRFCLDGVSPRHPQWL